MTLHMHRGIHWGAGDAAAPRLLVLHDLNAAGSDWQDVLDAWPGPNGAPDLPGHGLSPPAEGGKYVPSDLTLAALRALQQLGWDDPGLPPTILGHGWGAFAAEHLAAAGRVANLILVDGLGGPWRSAGELAENQMVWLRTALGAHALPAATPDPILRLGFPDVWHEDTTRGRRAAIAVPVLAFETPASPTPAEERQARLAMFGGPVRLQLASRDQLPAVLSRLPG
jgi:pimeloyl-ACP methyl ester carboxylesterase